MSSYRPLALAALLLCSCARGSGPPEESALWRTLEAHPAFGSKHAQDEQLWDAVPKCEAGDAEACSNIAFWGPAELEAQFKVRACALQVTVREPDGNKCVVAATSLRKRGDLLPARVMDLLGCLFGEPTACELVESAMQRGELPMQLDERSKTLLDDLAAGGEPYFWR